MTSVAITFATLNLNKINEAREIFETARLAVSMVIPSRQKDVEETGETFLANARLKAAAQVPEKGTCYVMGEDAGLVIPALAGAYGYKEFPGTHAKRWMTPEVRCELLGDRRSGSVTDAERNAGILKLMAGKSDREAWYVSAVALAVNHALVFEAEGRMPLRIIAEGTLPRGEDGFAYDAIVHPVIDGLPEFRTVAQLPAAEKNAISHRRRALDQMIDYLLCCVS